MPITANSPRVRGVTRILLVRHGQTEWNRRPPRFRGRAEMPLSRVGLAQARATAWRIGASWSPRAVFTSPLGRSWATGEIVAARLGVPVESRPGFIDLDYGQWQGLTVDEVRRSWPAEFDAWTHRPHLARIPGGESLDDVMARVSAEFRALLREHPLDTIVLVGHNSVNRVLLLHALDLPLSSFRTLVQSHCAISELTYDGKCFAMWSMNQTHHLDRIDRRMARTRRVLEAVW